MCVVFHPWHSRSTWKNHNISHFILNVVNIIFWLDLNIYREEEREKSPIQAHMDTVQRSFFYDLVCVFCVCVCMYVPRAIGHTFVNPVRAIQWLIFATYVCTYQLACRHYIHLFQIQVFFLFFLSSVFVVHFLVHTTFLFASLNVFKASFVLRRY